MLSLYVVIYFA